MKEQIILYKNVRILIQYFKMSINISLKPFLFIDLNINNDDTSKYWRIHSRYFNERMSERDQIKLRYFGR